MELSLADCVEAVQARIELARVPELTALAPALERIARTINARVRLLESEAQRQQEINAAVAVIRAGLANPQLLRRLLLMKLGLPPAKAAVVDAQITYDLLAPTDSQAQEVCQQYRFDPVTFYQALDEVTELRDTAATRKQDAADAAIRSEDARQNARARSAQQRMRTARKQARQPAEPVEV